MKDNLIQNKSYSFAVKIAKLYKRLIDNKVEFVLSKQLLRSGASIGANVEEAIGAQSKKDFISKLTIAYKEARETSYWLRILHEVEYISKEDFQELFEECNQILRIISKIQLTSKTNCNP